ncbi:hypothetical protein [Klebsiella quasipneumoniae]|uniref:hypothetical protein n=1 Tax=Klebsiella quasipneumoniae TaxID=1463165 RepID=UPI0021156E12|nr:hypothetical protein [Klebsiella quasipneumoniae]
MRAIPTFPRYRLAKPPIAKRWFGGGAALVLLSGIIAAMARKSGANTSIILICMVGMVLLGGVVWFVRTIFFRLSVHHSHTWERETENERRHWWEIHRRQFALKDIVLIGPAGAELSDWLRMIKREHQAPLVRQESLGKSLRIARSWICPYISRHLLSLNPLLARCRRYSRGER